MIIDRGANRNRPQLWCARLPTVPHAYRCRGNLPIECADFSSCSNPQIVAIDLRINTVRSYGDNSESFTD
jgi:hypothetical protein